MEEEEQQPEALHEGPAIRAVSAATSFSFSRRSSLRRGRCLALTKVRSSNETMLSAVLEKSLFKTRSTLKTRVGSGTGCLTSQSLLAVALTME